MEASYPFCHSYQISQFKILVLCKLYNMDLILHVLLMSSSTKINIHSLSYLHHLLSRALSTLIYDVSIQQCNQLPLY